MAIRLHKLITLPSSLTRKNQKKQRLILVRAPDEFVASILEIVPDIGRICGWSRIN